MKLAVIKEHSDIYFEDCNFNVTDWEVKLFEDIIETDYDAYFQVNVKKRSTANDPIYDFILESQKPFLVCESTPFRKNITRFWEQKDINKIYYRLGWDHYLRQGKFNNQNSPSDRWNEIQKNQNIVIKDWQKKDDGHILLCLQKPNDSSLYDIYNTYEKYNGWIYDTIKEIRKYSERKIVIRPHLKSKNIRLQELKFDNIEVSQFWNDRTIYEGGQGLENDFKNAYVVVAYNSNVLVESVCEGIPSISLSNSSIAYPVTNSLKNIENLNLDIDRTQWLYDTSYMIWNTHEIINGVAWNHLKEVYF